MPLNNSQYESIIRSYNRKQISHRHALEERREHAFTSFPRLKEIDAEIASASVKSGRRMLSGDTAALQDLKEQIALLSLERRQILKSGGYPDNYLEMTYDCADCRDTGYIDGQKCHCFKKAEIDLLYTQSNLQDVLLTENFGTFSLDYYSDNLLDPVIGISSLENMRRILPLCQKAIHDIGTVPANLFLYGDTGVGKTFLSHCIAKALLDSAYSVVYFSARELFEIFAEKRFSHTEEGTVSTDAIYSCDMLVIDDLGTELTNSFVNSELFFCLNERLVNRKSTMISTNLSLQAFADTYSERIFSRISNNYTMLKMFGKDIRLLKRLQGK